MAGKADLRSLLKPQVCDGCVCRWICGAGGGGGGRGCAVPHHQRKGLPVFFGRRNSGLCVPWLTFSKLGECLGWLLIPERTSFSGSLSQFCLLSSPLAPRGADDFQADMCSGRTSWSTCGGKDQLAFCSGRQFCFSGLACWDYFLSAC